MLFWLGGWGADMDAEAQGIGALSAGEHEGLAGGPLAFLGTVRSAPSPSWLAAHPTKDVVYATLEKQGRLAAFARTGERTLVPLGRPVEIGEAVCHAAVAPDGTFLVASCWGDGRVVRVALDATGAPSGTSVAQAARDPHAGGAAAAPMAGGIDLVVATRALREAAGEYAHLIPDAGGEDEATGADGNGADGAEAAARPADADASVSRAHAAAFLRDGRIATTDLGLDLVRIWRDEGTRLGLDHEVVLPRGSGPRHMVVHPSGYLYVVTELSSEVYVLGADRTGRWRLVSAAPSPPGALATDAGAGLVPSRDGHVLYAGLRGSDTIAVLRVTGAGERLEHVALVDAGVAWPRDHIVVHDTLLVAGQHSHEVASSSLDLRTGVPGRVRHRVEAPSPTALLAAG
ncbi:lactonase family protein [Microbacterium sp. LRZ72]|uniref:lactonase family protein n=1 Tax=Microbacterium sp. LRZ72 TaxID=2942481 RepID=UPI0029BF3337|nr:beta-propeller fold lactonase family protein [Microbacterium sp. LRZ72]MDX2376276.1 lactonase family protein [Microbacterium sp. LRZ72]